MADPIAIEIEEPAPVTFDVGDVLITSVEWGNISGTLSNQTDLQTALDGKGTYSKPSGGIPSTDMTTAVQISLGKADTALQEHQSLSAYSTTAQMNTAIAAHHDSTKLDIHQGSENEGKIMKVDANGDLALANFYQITANEAGGNTLTL